MSEYTNNIEQIMEQKGMPTLKAIAAVFDLNPVRLYSVAKQPKEGVVYDAKVYNWDAIERFITRRLDADQGLATLEDVIDAALIKDEELKASDGRRSSNRGEGSAWNAKIEVDGQMIAKRRFANFEKENGCLVTLKKDAEVYAIVLQTASHTVLRPVICAEKNEAGEYFFKGTGPSALEASIEERFSGEYAKKLAAELQAAADAAAEAAE